jgi:hypothetical protein
MTWPLSTLRISATWSGAASSIRLRIGDGGRLIEVPIALVLRNLTEQPLT